MNIAILGANSHIARGLINNFTHRDDACSLILYTRSPQRTREFLNRMGAILERCQIKSGYDDFLAGGYDVIINCVGAGTPDKLNGNYSRWFTLTEHFDNLVLDYLQRNSDTLYVNFSSGAVYGKNSSGPVEENTVNTIYVNHIPPEDYYTIARLNSEAKHRSFSELNIVDLRIFAYFSRFIDLNSGYFISEVMRSIVERKTLITSPDNMVRDYIHPDDLMALIMLCIRTGKLNAAFDAVSLAPVEKFQVLDLFKDKYNLQYEVSEAFKPVSPNGGKNVYCSNYNKAAELGYHPEFSSIQTIEQEASYILVR